MVEMLQEAQPEPDRLNTHAASEDALEQVQDEPLPDPTITPKMMERYGYTDTDMLPLSKDRAMELAERDITVYLLHNDNTEEMVFEPDEIDRHEGLCGITRADWNAVKSDVPQRDVEQRFLNSPTDAMVIYQLKDDAPPELHFTGLSRLKQLPQRENYEPIYTREVYPGDDINTNLENFYYIFNMDRPADFTGHSLSVSDIIAIKRDGVVSCHYCDSIGFQELPDFLHRENPLKTAEMQMEDDYDMVDGIINNGPKQPTVAELEEQVKSGQPISLLDLAEAVQREKEEKRQKPAPEKKPSILAKIRKPLPDREKTAPEKSAEKEHTR
jgi:hypothetical protein